MPPKVTVVLPVYNVAPYLRQCLDSVAKQTLPEIQVLCVDDGSTDASPDILDEYDRADSRFTVLHQTNQGAGSARNAAYAAINGRYTYFADPDDWLALDLCEKAFQKAEQAEADAVYLRMTGTEPGLHAPKFDAKLPPIRLTPQEKVDLFHYFNGSVLKFWKSDFLTDRQILFSEGKRPYNDMVQNWKGCALARRIAVLDEPLYFRRIRPGSYQTSVNRSHFAVFDAMNEVEQTLYEIGKYEEHREIFQSAKLASFRRTYLKMPVELRPAFRRAILEAVSDEDRKFLHDAPHPFLPRKIKAFYSALERPGFFGTMTFRLLEMLSQLGKWSRSHFFVPLKQFYRRPA